MIDRVGAPVSDIPRSRAFFAAALAPLGCSGIMEFGPDATDMDPAAAGFWRDGEPDLWIGGEEGLTGVLHVALSASDRATVEAFHAAALAAGGRDNGGPGLRPHDHSSCSAAFVRDPEGHNIELVCHAPACPPV
ncbi:VOC family protein [Rhodoplanes azumiensis]|uniref:VOC family protein n=1 Tax=Rhodoplanes azumiensis TaxID=1897628 RepID=A0ABW5AHI2_9BRAD